MSTDERITELEIRVAHLDAAAQTMSDELAAQQRRHQALHAEIQQLRERLVTPHEPEETAAEPPPPHY